MFCSPSLSHLTHLRRVPNRRDWAGRDGLTDEREDSVSSAVISKGVNALSNRYSAPRKKISMNTKAITNICEELKGVQIKVKVRREKKRNGENVKKKKKKESLMPGCREERMQEDTVGNGPFGYTASQTCNEDAREESFRAISFLPEITAEDKEKRRVCSSAICISHNNNKTVRRQFDARSVRILWFRKRERASSKDGRRSDMVYEPLVCELASHKSFLASTCQIWSVRGRRCAFSL